MMNKWKKRSYFIHEIWFQETQEFSTTCRVSEILSAKRFGSPTSGLIWDGMFVSNAREYQKRLLLLEVPNFSCLVGGARRILPWTNGNVFTKHSICFVLCHEQDLRLLQICHNESIGPHHVLLSERFMLCILETNVLVVEKRYNDILSHFWFSSRVW